MLQEQVTRIKTCPVKWTISEELAIKFSLIKFSHTLDTHLPWRHCWKSAPYCFSFLLFVSCLDAKKIHQHQNLVQRTLMPSLKSRTAWKTGQMFSQRWKLFCQRRTGWILSDDLISVDAVKWCFLIFVPVEQQIRVRIICVVNMIHIMTHPSPSLGCTLILF